MKLTALIISILLTLFSTHSSRGQYVWSKKMYTDDMLFWQNNEISGKIGYKGLRKEVRLFQNIRTDNSDVLIVKTIGLNNLRQSRIDTLRDSITSETFGNFIVGDSFDIIFYEKKMLVYQRSSGRHSLYGDDNFVYNNGYLINDSLVCLYRVYNYHPADGFSGLHLAIFNLNKMEFVTTKKINFSGIGLSNMNANWVYANSEYIYIVSPMTGILHKYDKTLTIIDTIIMPINWSNIDKNVAFQYKIDSTISSEYNRLKDTYAMTGKWVRNYVYNSDFIHKTIDDIRAHYEYIEKMMPYNDSVVLLVFYKPNYNFEKRDLIYYNINSNVVVHSDSEWQCSAKTIINDFEDYFTVNIFVSPNNFPYFFNGKVYYPTFANPNLYKNDKSLDILINKIMGDGKQNGHKWRLLEYNLPPYNQAD